ncbi:MAG: peptide ABC transporter substrate-binding protein [Fimbriimonas ginsengisoli]|uniref:Peptide ABC transporter substrate-binding protein n=1 Tax=Fimbriimonas ginsengisoli TaxID=1005039 RepID=A0A931LTW6_FIMGI|nr:peptide ABC transporter substrate-binding protein [Fimbriimonas ginsengisoli]
MRVPELGFVVFASLALVAACGKGDVSEKVSQGKANVFRYPIVTTPTSLDPGIVQDGDTIDLIQQVFEGLVAWGENNQPVPNLATGWTISPDGKTYTFTIKKGVKFHNGRELEAEDFKFAMERTCNPKFNSQTAENYLGDIVGVMDKLHGKAKNISGISAPDKTTLKITIDKPRPHFLGKLTYPCAFAVAREATPAGEIRSVKEMIGTGPYRAESYTPDQIFVLGANKDYHGGTISVDRIERPVVKDAATRLNMYKNGEIDLVQLERQDVKGLRNDPKLKDHLKFFVRPAIWYVGFNLKAYPPFADLRVRKAFTMAVDRESIVRDILDGINVVADGILPPGVIGHRDNPPGFKYNPEEARKLLAEAGFAGGKGLPALELTFREQRPDIRVVAEAVASQLKKNLGVEVSLRTMEWRAYLEKHNAKKQVFFHMRWAADYLDPQNFLSLMLSTNGNENKTYYSNGQVDALCEKADADMNQEERLALYQKAEDLILADAAWIPIYFQKDAELINPRVQGLRESLFGHLPHTTVRLLP